MNPVFIDLGNIKIYWYSIMILLGILIGGSYALKEAKKYGISEDFMINLLFFLIPFSLIGARLYFVLFNWSYYSTRTIEIFKVWEGGLAIHGAIIVGILWILIYTKKYQISTLRILDIAAVGIIIGQAIGRWGNFFNGEAHGPITTLAFLENLHLPNFIIKGMYISGNYYHPTFLYESLWCLLGFILLLGIRKIKTIKLGQITALYLMWYSIGRFLIESLRTDSLMFLGFKMAQCISIFLFIIGMILFLITQFSNKKRYYKDKENMNGNYF